MAAKILALFALLALSASATTAQLLFPASTPADITSILPPKAVVPCVQYATLRQVLAATAGISPASAIALQQALNFYRQQCVTHLALQGAASLLPQQQIIQQVLPILLQQVQQQVLLPYLLSAMATSANPAAYSYAQLQQQIPFYYFLNAAAANPAAAFFGQPQSQQLIQSILNQATAFGQPQQLWSPFFFNPLAAATTSPAAYYAQQQQQLPFFYNQDAIFNFNTLAAATSPAAYFAQQQQQLPFFFNQGAIFNTLAEAAATSPAALFGQQPFFAGAACF